MVVDADVVVRVDLVNVFSVVLFTLLALALTSTDNIAVALLPLLSSV